jgi:hypothetical protein
MDRLVNMVHPRTKTSPRLLPEPGRDQEEGRLCRNADPTGAADYVSHQRSISL